MNKQLIVDHIFKVPIIASCGTVYHCSYCENTLNNIAYEAHRDEIAEPIFQEKYGDKEKELKERFGKVQYDLYKEERISEIFHNYLCDLLREHLV